MADIHIARAVRDRLPLDDERLMPFGRASIGDSGDNEKLADAAGVLRPWIRLTGSDRLSAAECGCPLQRCRMLAR